MPIEFTFSSYTTNPQARTFRIANLTYMHSASSEDYSGLEPGSPDAEPHALLITSKPLLSIAYRAKLILFRSYTLNYSDPLVSSAWLVKYVDALFSGNFSNYPLSVLPDAERITRVERVSFHCIHSWFTCW